MRLESAFALRDELCETQARKPFSERTEAYAASVGPLPVPGVALGVTRDKTSIEGFRLAVFAYEREAALRMYDLASGEAVIYHVPEVKARVTPKYLQGRLRPIESGAQWRRHGSPYVGTGGPAVRAFVDRSVVLVPTCEHVVGIGAPRGTVMTQGEERVGIVYGVGGVSFRVPFESDTALVALDRSLEYSRFDHGLRRDFAGFRRRTAEDIGQHFTNTGRTLGTRNGICIAVGVMGQPIAYEGGVGFANNLGVYRTIGGEDFSAGGHSGAPIASMDDAHIVDWLIAGGPDLNGDDLSYGCDAINGVVACGGVPELA